MYKNEIFIDNVKKYRKKLKLKSNEFAIALDINYSYLSDIECNKKIPTSKIVVNMANFFNLSINELMDNTKDIDVKDTYRNIIVNFLHNYNDFEINYFLEIAKTFTEGDDVDGL